MLNFHFVIMKKKTKIEISTDLKNYLDWCDVNKRLSYDRLIWTWSDLVSGYFDWSEKHPKFTEEIRKLSLKKREKRLAFLKRKSKGKKNWSNLY